MKLIPEQVWRIRKEIRKLKKGVGSYSAYYEDRNTAGAAKSPGNQYGDFFTEHGLDIENDKLKKYSNLIRKNSFMYDRDYEKIDCGTKFRYYFVDEPNIITEGMLSDSMEGLSSHEGFISLSSNLGQAVYGHKEGDVCIFEGVEDSQVIKIVDIEKNRQKYINFIRSVPYSARRSRRGRCEIRDEIKNSSKEHEKRKEITASQRELLKEELERISSCLNTKNITSSKSRITLIKNYLSSRSIATPRFDGTIETGIKFMVTLMNKNGSTITKSLEMINVALGDELDCDYVERFSSLGSAVYGLREGDEFTYYVKGVGIVSGYVHDIEIKKVKDATVNNHQYIK